MSEAALTKIQKDVRLKSNIFFKIYDCDTYYDYNFIISCIDDCDTHKK